MNMTVKMSAQARNRPRKEPEETYLKEQRLARQAVQEKTARLRALRLAKEAEEKAAAEAAPPKAPPRKRTAPKAGKEA